MMQFIILGYLNIILLWLMQFSNTRYELLYKFYCTVLEKLQLHSGVSGGAFLVKLAFLFFCFWRENRELNWKLEIIIAEYQILLVCLCIDVAKWWVSMPEMFLIQHVKRDSIIAFVHVHMSVRLEAWRKHVHYMLRISAFCARRKIVDIHLSKVLLNVSVEAAVQTWDYYLKVSYWKWGF
jgi:hypothetical protein